MEIYRKLRIDLIILFIITFLPVGFWLLESSVVERFSTFIATFTSLGQLTGLGGMTLIALSMILQLKLCRLLNPVLAKPTTLTNLHHFAGIYGLFLVILHPLFLSIRYLPISVEVAAGQLYNTDLIFLAGLFALVLMIVSMFVTLFVPRNFRYWKLFHQILLVSYLLIVYHLLFVTSDISRNVMIRYYLFTIIFLGGFAFAWQKGRHYLNILLEGQDEITC